MTSPELENYGNEFERYCNVADSMLERVKNLGLERDENDLIDSLFEWVGITPFAVMPLNFYIAAIACYVCTMDRFDGARGMDAGYLDPLREFEKNSWIGDALELLTLDSRNLFEEHYQRVVNAFPTAP